MIAMTPPIASAAVTSMARTRPVAMVLRTNAAYAMSGYRTSEGYGAVPATLSGQSTRSTGAPITGSDVAVMR
jgi:hypothetical protein